MIVKAAPPESRGSRIHGAQEEMRMRWKIGVAAAVVWAAFGGAPAAAIDVQGTWEARATCSFYLADQRQQKVVADFGISIEQLGDGGLEIDIPAFETRLLGQATDTSDAPEPATRGVLGAGTCGPGGAVVGGLQGDVKVSATVDGSLMGRLSGLAIGSPFGLPLAGPFECVVKARRTDASNPDVPDPCE
jgi:hypothetical protein